MVIKSIKNLGKIGVLMGGISSERDISLRSGQAVYNALKRNGLKAVDIDIKTRDDLKKNITKENIKLAFIMLHGVFGEDGQVQQILENMNIKYTGSDVKASKLAMDKIEAKKIFSKNDIPSPDYCQYMGEKKLEIKFPVIVKPSSGGSSLGVNLVNNRDELCNAVRIASRYDKKIMIEEYIKGREITVGILNNKAFDIVEIITVGKSYDYKAKYEDKKTRYIVPAQIEKKKYCQIQNTALKAHNLLGCRGATRVDMLLKEDGEHTVLEVNTIPGMTEQSLLPKSVKGAGIDFDQLCIEILKAIGR